MQKIETAEQFDQLFELGKPFTFLKHSVTCPISQAAYEEYVQFAEENPNLNSYYLTVQDSRELSNYIAEKFQIKHESPQAFFFSNQKIVWHASHWKITYDALVKVKKEIN